MFLKSLRSRSVSDPAVTAAEPEPAAPPFYRTHSNPEMFLPPPPEYDDGPPALAAPPPAPRDEEGNEPLPPYRSVLTRTAVLHRKLELTSPFEIASARSWSSVVACLNNTQLNLYRLVPDRNALTSWRTRHNILATVSSAVSAASATALAASSMPPRNTAERGGRADAYDDHFTIDPFGTTDDLAQLTPPASPAASAASLPAPALSALQALTPDRLIRSYTLQYAQIGLATDYKKKPYVIRVRAEGQQFLLQCHTAQECVEWTNALQAAADLSLPLDERETTVYRSIPSSRRRRVLPSARNPATGRRRRRRAEREQPAVDVTSSTPEPAPAAGPPADDDDDDDYYYHRGARRGSATDEDAGSDAHSDGPDGPDAPTDADADTDAISPADPADLAAPDDDTDDKDAPTPVSPASRRPSSERAAVDRRRLSTFFACPADDEDEKWVPTPGPKLSAHARIRYAVRCLYTLPADSSWGNKLLVPAGGRLVVRERIQPLSY
ncbi:uncharacterized protein V1510DRAFT_234200 [Dipodascopsis tothii]|uniref:uncharacterized protein n=1 Tax=Dipodascopsis tothii TaxID=44089 RepID=UPI0034CD161C